MQEIVIDAGALGLAGVNRSFLSLADDDHDYGRAPSRTLIVHRLDGLDAFRLAATPFTSGVEFRLTWDRHGLVGWTAFQITTNIHERHQPPQISFKETLSGFISDACGVSHPEKGVDASSNRQCYRYYIDTLAIARWYRYSIDTVDLLQNYRYSINSHWLKTSSAMRITRHAAEGSAPETNGLSPRHLLSLMKSSTLLLRMRW